MAPSWPALVPEHMDDGSRFPAVTAFALPAELSPPFDPSRVDSELVDRMVEDFLLPVGVVPLNLAPNLAQALIFGIQSVFNVQRQQQRA